MKQSIREKVWLKYGKHCAYCGKVLAYNDMQVDHLTPQSMAHYYRNETIRNRIGAKGNDINSFENLMPSCRRCNHYKRSYRLAEFRHLMRTLHERVKKQYIVKVAIDYGIVKIKPFDGVFYFEKDTS